MATNLAAIIAGSRRNYGVDKYNPDPEARRLALQRALMAQQYQTAMSAPAGPYSGVNKLFTGLLEGQRNLEEQRRNALREAARRAYMSQMIAGGPAAASGGASALMPSVGRSQRALMPPAGARDIFTQIEHSSFIPMEKSFPAMEGGPQPPAGQLDQLLSAPSAQEVRNIDYANKLTSDPVEAAWNRRRGVEARSIYVPDSRGDSVADPTVAEAAGEASYDIEGTSLGGAPLDDTVVTEEAEVSVPGGLTTRKTAAEVEDDDDRHLLSQFGDWLLGGRELTPELADAELARMSPEDRDKVMKAAFPAGSLAISEALGRGDAAQARRIAALLDPASAIKYAFAKTAKPVATKYVHFVVPKDHEGFNLGGRKFQPGTHSVGQQFLQTHPWLREQLNRGTFQVVKRPDPEPVIPPSGLDLLGGRSPAPSQQKPVGKKQKAADLLDYAKEFRLGSFDIWKMFAKGLSAIEAAVGVPDLTEMGDEERAAANRINNIKNKYAIPLVRAISARGGRFAYEQIEKILPGAKLDIQTNETRVRLLRERYLEELRENDLFQKYHDKTMNPATRDKIGQSDALLVEGLKALNRMVDAFDAQNKKKAAETPKWRRLGK
jgi:hypothetical protein